VFFGSVLIVLGELNSPTTESASICSKLIFPLVSDSRLLKRSRKYWVVVSSLKTHLNAIDGYR
jgi:hypothetical protein